MSASRRPTNALVTAMIAAALLAAACTGEPDLPLDAPRGAPTVEEMLKRLGADPVERLARGYFPARSADIALVPAPGNVVVRWSGVGLGTDDADPSTTHPTPWDYHQRVPIVLYGPGFVRSRGQLERSVDLTDLATSMLSLLDCDVCGTHERGLLHEALLPSKRDSPIPTLPKVVVIVAYDGGGWNLLERWPDAWPVLRRLMSDGTTYVNATIGSAPSVTSAIHANMGTGAYPREHGISEITSRLPDGSIGDVFLDAADPSLLEVTTVADQWDRERDNEPWVGMIGYESWHLGMMGHGAQLPGGDRDVAVLWEPEPGLGEFFTNEDFYELPTYLPGEDALAVRLDALDAEDGQRDGRWFDNDLRDPTIVPGTPAFVEHQGEALLEIVRREPIGDDALTDLLFVELKPTDFGGHIWNMLAPEEEHVLRAQDRLLGDLVRELDRKVGRDRYVLAYTADHGQTPLPETVDGLRVHPDILGAKVEAYFGRDIVEMVTPDGMFLRLDELEAAGLTVEDVARFVADFRFGDGLPPDADPAAVPPERLDERVFAGAIPGSVLGSLSPEEIDALGPGDYPEGDLTTPPGRIGTLAP